MPTLYAYLLLDLSFACIQYGDAYDLSSLIPDYDIIIREFRIIGVARFLKIDVKYIRLLIVCRPNPPVRDL